MRFKQRSRIDQRGNRPRSSTWPVAYKWLAMGTAVVYTAVGTKTINVAYAADAVSATAEAGLGSRTEALPAKRYDIPAGPLESVLSAFRPAAAIEVVVPQNGMNSLPSPGVSGYYTVEQALQKLLAGTGVGYRFTGDAAVTLELRGLATSIDVAGSVEQVTSPKYTEPLRDTPQSISVVPREILQQQGVTTLRDTLRNVAGISLAAGEGGAQGDNLTIRGFTARNDLFIDGMRDFGSYYRDPFNLEEVEVLQGPSSVTFGRGSTGGVVNQETKTPGLNRFISGDAVFGTDLTRRVTLDINTPVPQLGSGAAFRLNLMGDINDVAERDVAENRRFGIAPSLSLGLGTPTRWTFTYLHQTADDNPDYGIPWYFNGPAPVDRQNYYGFRDGNYLRTYDDIGTARVEHDFNKHLTLRNQTRYANYVRDVLITEAQLPSTVTLATPLDAISVTRHEIGVNSTETFLDTQFDLVADFETGPIRHKLLTGVEAGRETSDPTRPTYSNVPVTSLLNPDPDQALSGTVAITSKVDTVADSVSTYALDTAQFGRHWELTGGIRWDRFHTDYTQSIAPVSAFERVDQMPTWRAALVYKPITIGSLYVSAGTSFNPSAESLSLTAGNADLPPEKNRSYEAGTKWDLKSGRFTLRSALFRTEKTNARETSPTNSLLVVLGGNQRVDGVQFEARGRLTSRWEILDSYAYLKSEVTSSVFYPGAVRYPLANVPRQTFNFWNYYHLPHHLDVGAGGNYVSSRNASSTVPLDPATGLVKQVPGYWVFNASASYPLTEHVSLQANVYNLANRYYYDELHPAHIVLGPGRSALIGFRFKF